MPINSRQKGARGERELAKHLTDRGYPSRRGQQFQGSPDSPDVVCESLKHLHIECKFVEALNVYKALRQAREDAGDHQTPVVIHRRKKEKWHVTLDLDDFLTLLEYENRMQVYTPELDLPE
jgi:Holliday junction resolvase